jgi:hypothetical protein
MLLLKLFYSVLFLSIIILLYLRLGKKIVGVGRWLAIAGLIWLIVLIVYLPIFHIASSVRLKAFLGVSGIMVSLILVHYMGRIMMWFIERSDLSDNIKEFLGRYLSVIFNSVIFWFYFLTFLIIFIVAFAKIA